MTLRVLERAWKETRKVTYDGVDAGKPVVAASVRACAALELLRIYSQARVTSEASERRVLNQQVIDMGVALARAELQRMPANKAVIDGHGEAVSMIIAAAVELCEEKDRGGK
jgi:hypothetical protein